MDIIFLVLKKQVDKRNMCNFAKALNTFNLNIPIAVLRFLSFMYRLLFTDNPKKPKGLPPSQL